MNHSIIKSLNYFLTQCTDAISAEGYEKNKHKTIQEGRNEFRLRLERASTKDFNSVKLPVLNALNTIAESAYTFNFHEIASELKWRPSPRTDFDAEHIALCTLNEMLDLGDLMAGLLFMTPEQIYPEHQHPPKEVYFVLSGTACWLYGGDTEYRQQQPGDIIYNHSHDLHGMKTGNESLLALYFLWGDKTEGYSY